MVATFFQESSRVLTDAIERGIVEHYPYSIKRILDERTSIYIPLMKQVKAQRERAIEPSPWLSRQQSWQLPSTRRFQDSRHPPVIPVVYPQGTPTDPWMVELARWPVPYGQIGILKNYQQYLADDDDNIYTTSAQWGNPFPAIDVTWYFRLSPITQVRNPWLSITGIGAIPERLPGIPYDDSAFSVGTWYPANSASTVNIHFPVPGGFVLRCLAIVQSFSHRPILAASLSGSIQYEMNEQASAVVSESW